MNTVIPTARDKLLASKENKQKVTDMFSTSLIRDVVTVKHAVEDGDADSLIVRETAKNCNTLVHSVDTAVFIALLYHRREEDYDIIMATKKGLLFIRKIRSVMHEELKSCLLFRHAVSG